MTAPSADALAALATAPPRGIPGPVNRATAPLLRMIVDARNRSSFDLARSRFEGTVSAERRADVPVARLTPTASHETVDFAVYVHGGAFLLGHAVDAVGLTMAQHSGLETISVDYDLVPEARYPRAVDQVAAVWSEVSRERGGRGVLIGNSAGGNLVLAALQRSLADGRADELPTAVVLISPWVDLTPPDPKRLRNEGVDPLIRWNGMLDKTARRYAGTRPAADPCISPLYGTYRGLTSPTLITTGTNDLFAPDCHALHQALLRDHVPVELDEAEAMWHAYQGYAALTESQDSAARIADFIARNLRH